MSLPDIGELKEVQEVINLALSEDIGRGDATSNALIGEDEIAQAHIVSRGECVVSGGEMARRVFKSIDADLDVRILAGDGQVVTRDQKVMDLKGRARSILAGERVALNFLQRMTGIATLTRRYVRKVAQFNVQILDTRKTTPGLRAIEKYAVVCGSGVNHRMGLYDRVLIKDNHRAFWRSKGVGGLAEAVIVARKANPGLEIEVEVEDENELREVLEAQPDWVLLDNMTPEQLRECVKICRGQCRIEASGGITLETIAAVAETGVDAISVGALTHSAPAADLSLEFHE